MSDPCVPAPEGRDAAVQRLCAGDRRPWWLSRVFAWIVMRVSVFLAVTATAGGIFAVGVLVGSTAGPWNSSTHTAGETGSKSPVSIPSCGLQITGGGFDSLDSRSQAWSDLLSVTIPDVVSSFHEGTVRARHLEQQTEQAWCLTLVTNAVIAWTTEYYGLAVESMRTAGRRIDAIYRCPPADEYDFQ
jgi:hypothetical protein